ncbi:MAG: HAD family hydrolase [Chloroflexi bacterium]|nr:HAD family hydrolase [Chloroflexota bacterium]
MGRNAKPLTQMPLNVARIKAVCLDIDGTLRDTDDYYVERVSRLLRPFKALLPGGDERKFARWIIMRLEGPGNLLITIPDRLGIDDKIASILGRVRKPRPHKHGRHLQIVAGADIVLEKLAEKYPLSVVTSRGKRTTMVFLEDNNLLQYFDHIATALTAERTKPHPGPILWAAQRMGVSAGECLMVGDTVGDIKAGKAAQAQTVGVLSGFGEEDELRDSGADLILGSVAELPGILLG